MKALRFFTELAMIPSPLYAVGKIQQHIASWLSKLFPGIISIVDLAGNDNPKYELGNMYIRVPASPGYEALPCLAVEAHVDTVPLIEGQNNSLAIKNGIVSIVRGGILGADDKAGVAAILAALTTIKDQPHGPIEVIFSVGEELSMYGIKEFNFKQLEAKTILCVDGFSPLTINNACAGKIKYQATFVGQSGHGAFPEKGINAIEMAAYAIQQCISFGYTGRLENGAIHNISEFQSHEGSPLFPSTNVIPGKAVVAGELRGLSSRELDNSFSQIKGLMERWAKRPNGGSVEIITDIPYPPFNVPDSRIVERLQKTNPNLQFSLKPEDGATHANVFNEKGFESVVIGAGCRNPHAKDEYLIIDELEQAAEIITNYLKA